MSLSQADIVGKEAFAKANIEALLDQRGSSVKGVKDLIGCQFSDVADILFVSTVTSGLAGSTSDVDVVVIVDGDLADERMSTMIFSEGVRLGVTAYRDGEIRAAIERLSSLSRIPPSRIVAARKDWDRGERVPWIELERCVNGYSFETANRYIAGLPSLAEACFGMAVEQFRRAVVLALLADYGGECRGQYGYAIVAVRALMDALMAERFDIHSNPKWVFERWSKFRPEQVKSPRTDLARSVAATWRWLLQGLSDHCVAPTAARMLDLYRESRVAFDVRLAEDRDPLRWRRPVRFFPFMDDVSMVMTEDGRFAIVEVADAKSLAGFSISDDMKVDPSQARSLLALMRSSLVDIPIDQTCFSLVERSIAR
jgi:hypothetical protein